MIKQLSRILATVGVVLVIPIVARADMISGVMNKGSSTAVDISSNTTDWAYYGRNTTNTAMELDYKSGGSQSFSDLIFTSNSGGTTSGIWYGDSTSAITPITYTGGEPTASRSNYSGIRYSTYGQNSHASLTHTLIGASETVTLMFGAYSTLASSSYTLSAVLSSGGVTTASYSESISPGAGNWRRIWNLGVSGSVGEVLSLTITQTTTGSDSILVEAATATVVPEPNTLTLTAAALLALAACAWRKQKH